MSSEVLVGGTDKQAQFKAFHRGVDTVIGTPGKICEMLRKKAFKLCDCQMLIIDEADSLLRLGFEEQMK